MEEPNADGFLHWIEENDNETFSFVAQIIFNYVLAVYIQKIGVQNNDITAIQAARYKFMPLFYGFKHPIYQEIEYRDLKDQICYPEAIKEVLEQNMSFTSSLELNHEGGDFCLENKIKQHKLLAPRGKVTDDMWKRISRSLDSIHTISDHASHLLNTENKAQYRYVGLYDEVVKWRAVLRLSSYLNRGEEGNVYNIYGEILSNDVAYLSENLAERMEKFWKLAEENVRLQNISAKLSYIRVKPSTEIDDLLHYPDSDSDWD